MTAEPSSVSFLTASSALFASCKGNARPGDEFQSLWPAPENRAHPGASYWPRCGSAARPTAACRNRTRHLVEVDGIDRHHSAFAQAGQRATTTLPLGAKVMARSSSTGGLHSRSHPVAPSDGRRRAMVLSPASPHTPGTSRSAERQWQAGRAAKAEKSHPLARFHPCHPQAAEADNPGAQQRRHMQIVQPGRQRENEIRARQGVLGVSAVDRISGERRMIAQVFHAVTAVPALPVHAPDPGDAGTASQRQFGRRAPTTSPTIWCPGISCGEAAAIRLPRCAGPYGKPRTPAPAAVHSPPAVPDGEPPRSAARIPAPYGRPQELRLSWSLCLARLLGEFFAKLARIDGMLVRLHG